MTARHGPARRGEAAPTERHHRQALKRVWHYLARFGDRSAADDA